MGAASFIEHGTGTDAREVFVMLRDQAQWEHGHGGYSGSIGEKGDFVVISSTPAKLDDAIKTAYKMLENDDRRVTDKWGPAGALAITLPYRTVKITGLNADSSSTDDVTAAARAHLGSKIKETEAIESAELHSYSMPKRSSFGMGYGARPRKVPITNATLTVKIKKSPRARASLDGWLFFGTAPE